MTDTLRVACEEDLRWVKSGIDAEEMEERSQKEIDATLTASSTPGHWRPAQVDKTV
jgi:hypothetical protein